MSSKNAKSQLNLAKFIDKAMYVRTTIIDLPNLCKLGYCYSSILTSHVNILFSLLFKTLVI